MRNKCFAKQLKCAALERVVDEQLAVASGSGSCVCTSAAQVALALGFELIGVHWLGEVLIQCTALLGDAFPAASSVVGTAGLLALPQVSTATQAVSNCR